MSINKVEPGDKPIDPSLNKTVLEYIDELELQIDGYKDVIRTLEQSRNLWVSEAHKHKKRMRAMVTLYYSKLNLITDLQKENIALREKLQLLGDM